MSTNSDFIKDVLLLIGVVPDTENPTAEQSVIALRHMNAMMDEWADSGVDVNWTAQTDPTAEFTLVGGEVAAAMYELAVRLSPVFQRPVTAEVALAAQRSYGRLLRTQINRDMEPLDLSLPESESVRQYFDITSG